jgi:RNA polymerase sigma factor (sigma-70 family)
MGDAEVATAIAAGDRAALGAAYDQHASLLYAYCRSQLSDPEDAANAVRDTFVVTACKLSRLCDPSRLRPWLHAVARNECRRRLRAGDSTALSAEAREVSDDTADFGGSLEQAGFRELVRSAFATLDDADREIIQLTLRQRLDTVDLTDALGVPRNKARRTASRARAEFAAAVAALLATRSGQGSCRELHEIVAGRGELTPALRKQVRLHIAHCDRCGARRRRDLRPGVLSGLLPEAVLSAGLRQQVLDMVTSTSPDAAAFRVAVADRAEPFGRSGFPVLIDPFAVTRGPAAYMPAAVALAAAFALLGGGAIYVAGTVHHAARSSASPAAGHSVPSVEAQPAASPSAVLPGGPRKKPPGLRVAARPFLAGTAQPSGARQSSAGSRPAPRPGPSSPGGSSPAPAPQPPPSSSPTPPPTPSPDPPPTTTPPAPTPTPDPTPTPTTPLPTLSPLPTPTLASSSLVASVIASLGLQGPSHTVWSAVAH